MSHLGFDADNIGTDKRAIVVLGRDQVIRIDEVLNKPRIVLKPTAPVKGKVVGRSWEFKIDVAVPG